jgi:hypothetical protein
MFYPPSLTGSQIIQSRQVEGIDAEGTPLQTYENIAEFRGGFGSVNTARENVRGDAGQVADAAVSTQAEVEVWVGDILNINGRDWKVIGVRETGHTKRILLQTWGVQ